MTIANKPALGLFVSWAISTACSSPSHRVVAPLPSDSQDAGSDVGVDAGAGIDEVEARYLLDQMFREAGFRIVNDAPWSELVGSVAIEVTLDGFDPESGVGYEYISQGEVGTELAGEELMALRGKAGILVLDRESRESVRARGAAFLAGRMPVLEAE